MTYCDHHEYWIWPLLRRAICRAVGHRDHPVSGDTDRMLAEWRLYTSPITEIVRCQRCGRYDLHNLPTVNVTCRPIVD